MKKAPFMTMLIALVISAIIGISIVAVDSWNATTAKLLLSSLTVFGFCIPGLLCILLYERNQARIFSSVGIITCLLSCLFCLSFIWFITLDTFSKILVQLLSTSILCSEYFGFVSLILLMKADKLLIKGLKGLTIILATLLNILYLIGIYVEEVDFRIIFILIILILLCTLLIPILNRMMKQSSHSIDNSTEKFQQLEQLKKLYDDNVLTEEEYNNEKAKILSSSN